MTNIKTKIDFQIKHAIDSLGLDELEQEKLGEELKNKLGGELGLFHQRLVSHLHDIKLLLNKIHCISGYFYIIVNRELGFSLLNDKNINFKINIEHIPYGLNHLVNLGTLDYTFKVILDPNMTEHKIYIGGIQLYNELSVKMYEDYYKQNITGEITIDNFAI